jgi:hypothetical protein
MDGEAPDWYRKVAPVRFVVEFAMAVAELSPPHSHEAEKGRVDFCVPVRAEAQALLPGRRRRKRAGIGSAAPHRNLPVGRAYGHPQRKPLIDA